MTPTPAELLRRERHYCDLCRELRPNKVRNLGKDWIDNYWACKPCKTLYSSILLPGEGRDKRVSA